MQILTRDAKVETVAVTLDTIKVSGKQMTQSVFGQLARRSFHESKTGVLWGWVNYHPDKCASEPAHIHFVWQDGSVIYRDRVDEYRKSIERHVRWADEAEFFYSAIRSGDAPKDLRNFRASYQFGDPNNPPYSVTISSWDYWSNLPNKPDGLRFPPYGNPPPPTMKEQELHERAREEAEVCLRILGRDNDLVLRLLNDSRHLFIAV